MAHLAAPTVGALHKHDDDAITRLMRWDAGNVIADETYARILAHPQLTDAIRRFADNMLAASARDQAMDGIFKDAGRYIAAMWTIYLDASGGLTLPKLKSMAMASGLLSPGRARALLSYLRYLDYVSVLPGRAAGEPVRYAPTGRLKAAWRDHLRAALDAICIIEPAVDILYDGLADPEILATFCRIQGKDILAMARGGDQTTAFVRIFLHRHAGTQLIWKLLVEADAFPPRAPIALSIAAMAREFNVSRIHIRRLLDEAEREGLLRYESNRTITIQDGMRSALLRLYPMQFILLLSAAAKTIVQRPDLAWPSDAPGAGACAEPGARQGDFISERVPA